jgi:hypothetical protein
MWSFKNYFTFQKVLHYFLRNVSDIRNVLRVLKISPGAMRMRGKLSVKRRNFKDSFQQKLRWVENGVIRWVWALHRGAGYYFVDLGGLHLDFAFFPFPVSTALIIGKFWKNR